MTDDKHNEDEQLKAEEQLYKAALDTPVTRQATDWLAIAYLVDRVTNSNVEAAKTVIHKPAALDVARREFDDLNDEERHALLRVVGVHWAAVVSEAVRRLRHAAGVLKIDPDTIDPEHVALTAAMLLGEQPPDVDLDAAA